MAMMNQRSKPQYYNIVGEKSGAIIATASYSKVMQVIKKLQPSYDEKLIPYLIVDDKNNLK